jgi:hypothetical protein
MAFGMTKAVIFFSRAVISYTGMDSYDEGKSAKEVISA